MRSEPLKAKPVTSGAAWKRLVARALPGGVAERLRELRALSGPERRAHVGMMVRRLLRRDPALPRGVSPDGTVLFVCYGNIIRSALAEALYRRHAAALWSAPVRVLSAGMRAKPGREADARAVAAGRSLGVDLTSHRAQPLTQSLVEEASVIFVMDRLNEAQLFARFPDARAKVRRLGALAKTEGSDVIGDPYVLNDAAVAAAAERIDRATAALANTVNETRRALASANPTSSVRP